MSDNERCFLWSSRREKLASEIYSKKLRAIPKSWTMGIDLDEVYSTFGRVHLFDNTVKNFTQAFLDVDSVFGDNLSRP